MNQSELLVVSLPTDRMCALFVRFAPPVSAEGRGRMTAELTEEGKVLANELGRGLTSRLVCVHTSAYPRFVQTADAIRDGAGFRGSHVVDRYVSDPSIYVVEGREKEAEEQFWQLGHDAMGERLMQDHLDLPGWVASPKDAARRLVGHMLSKTDDAASKLGCANGVGVFVSHDVVIAATVAHILGTALTREEWPEHLEGVVIWREGSDVQVKYRNRGGICRLAV